MNSGSKPQFDKHLGFLNAVILHGKYYIYYAKKQSKELCLYEFLLMLKQELKLKKLYHTENNRNQIFEKKCQELSLLVFLFSSHI